MANTMLKKRELLVMITMMFCLGALCGIGWAQQDQEDSDEGTS